MGFIKLSYPVLVVDLPFLFSSFTLLLPFLLPSFILPSSFPLSLPSLLFSSFLLCFHSYSLSWRGDHGDCGILKSGNTGRMGGGGD